MNIKNIVVGHLATNCYIVEKGDTCIIIDPGAEVDKILKHIDSTKKVLGVFITHGHDDHIGAVVPLVDKYKCPIYNGSNLNEGVNTFANFRFKVIRFPGHLDDQIAFYFEDQNIMFDGDFVFKGSIGRYDLAGASPYDMKDSIKKILTMDPNIILLPGHGERTILKDEIDTLNYFINIL